MSNPFETLGFQPTLAVDPTWLENRYLELSKECHPDSPNGDPDRFAELGTARSTITSPSRRIAALLDALTGSHTDGSSSAPRAGKMSGELMDLFAELSPALQVVEDVARRKHEAKSELARALLANEELAARAPLEKAGIAVQAAINQRVERFGPLDHGIGHGIGDDLEKQLRELSHELAFLEKWQSQIRETLMKLFV